MVYSVTLRPLPMQPANVRVKGPDQRIAECVGNRLHFYFPLWTGPAPDPRFIKAKLRLQRLETRPWRQGKTMGSFDLKTEATVKGAGLTPEDLASDWQSPYFLEDCIISIAGRSCST